MSTRRSYICEFCKKEFSNSHAKAGHIRGHKVNSSEIMKKVWKRQDFREKRKVALEKSLTFEHWKKVCQGVQKHWDTHPERKQETSERMSAEWKDPNSKLRKIFHSKKHREIMSKIKKEQSKDIKYLEKLSNSHKIWWNNLPEKKKLKILENLAEIKKYKKETKIEISVYNKLCQEGLKKNLHKQYKIFAIEPKKYFIIDLCYPKHKLAIECDGDYWHTNPKIYDYPNKTQINSVKQDLEKNKFMTSKGFKILRFYETDIKQNLQLCTDLIHEELLLRNYVS